MEPRQQYGHFEKCENFQFNPGVIFLDKYDPQLGPYQRNNLHSDLKSHSPSDIEAVAIDDLTFEC